MRETTRESVLSLKNAGWRIGLSNEKRELPYEVRERYSWLSSELLETTCNIEFAVNHDESAWFLSPADYHGDSDSAFSWNQWEEDSLAAAEGDSELECEIRDFWDEHFPFLYVIRDSYSYFALRKSDSAIVCGEEPAYEDSIVVASSIQDCLARICDSGIYFHRR